MCLDKSIIAIVADPMSEHNVRHLCKCQKYVMYMYVVNWCRIFLLITVMNCSDSKQLNKEILISDQLG